MFRGVEVFRGFRVLQCFVLRGLEGRSPSGEFAASLFKSSPQRSICTRVLGIRLPRP